MVLDLKKIAFLAMGTPPISLSSLGLSLNPLCMPSALRSAPTPKLSRTKAQGLRFTLTTRGQWL